MDNNNQKKNNQNNLLNLLNQNNLQNLFNQNSINQNVLNQNNTGGKSDPGPFGPCTQDAEVTEAKTLVNATNIEFPLENAVVKVPILLAAPVVTFNVEAKIRLAEPALEIKRIKKTVHVTQCELIPYTDQLFIGGYVRKNIEYATAQRSSATAVSGDIRHTTVHVPFEFSTTVNDLFVTFGYRDEFEFVFNGQENKQFASETYIDPEEKPFCEIEFIYIDEVDLFLDRKPLCTTPNEAVFQNIREKMSIVLGISVLQNRLAYLDDPFREGEGGQSNAAAAPAKPGSEKSPRHPLAKIHPSLPKLPRQNRVRLYKRP